MFSILIVLLIIWFVGAICAAIAETNYAPQSNYTPTILSLLTAGFFSWAWFFMMIPTPFKYLRK